MRYTLALLAFLSVLPPLLAQGGQVKLLPGDGADSDNFGRSVAISGTTAIVGAIGDDDNGDSSGSAYLFDTTTGTQIVKLLPADGAADDQFGQSVAISGTTAIVGAGNDDDNGESSGSAYLFDTATGTQIAKLLPADGEALDYFGESVAISGTTAIVGAYGDDDNGSFSGSAYLFDTTTGSQIAKLLPDDGAGFEFFGTAVGISGTTAIVGADGDNENGLGSGSAYLFDTTTGAQIAKLVPSGGAVVWEGARAGRSVAISGTTAIVGAPLMDVNGPFVGGAVLFDTTTGVASGFLFASDGVAEAEFGISVGISGTTAIVGARGDGTNGIFLGTAYLFDTSTSTEIAKFLPGDISIGDRFGYSVAISGATAIAGAEGESVYGFRSGSAYRFLTDCYGDGGGNSPDCDRDGIPDECETDCNQNGIPDDCETFADCNSNGIPDDCDPDCDNDGIPDECEPDCDSDGIPDECELDCDSDGVPDDCELDCDGNGIPDECDLADNPGLDLNQNGILDSCECIVESYCITSPNTAGAGAVMGVAGSSSVSVNDLVLLAGSCPSGQFGVFFYGPEQVQVPFGDGFRCVGAGSAGLYRFPPVSTGLLGVAGYTVDNTDPPYASGQITAGSTWNFQFWYRDPMGGPAGFNLSDALEITFCP